MTYAHISLSRRNVLVLAAASLAAGCAARSGVVVQPPADFKLQPIRVQASFKPAKLMVTVNGPGGLIQRVEPKQAAEAERLIQEFAEKLATDFEARFNDDARVAGLPLQRDKTDTAPTPTLTLTLSIPLATVSYQLPGATHYRGDRPFVLFNVTNSLTDVSGREVWNYKGGTMPTPETALPENKEGAGYRLLSYSLFQALRSGGILPAQPSRGQAH